VEREIDLTDNIEPKSHNFARAKVTESGSGMDPDSVTFWWEKLCDFVQYPPLD
jgi:hypothetical protein